MTVTEYARDCLRELVRYVFECRNEPIGGLGYGELSARIGRLNKHGRGHPRGLGPILDEMGHLLQNLEGRWGERIPHIQSLVVQQTGSEKNLPSDGIREFWADYPSMSRKEKETRTQIEFQEVARFGSRWNDVLRQLDLNEIKQDNTVSTRPYGGGGESDSHKNLKDFIFYHPEVVGAGNDWRSNQEYPLPSGDTIDVLFRSSNECIAVEVKSTVSDSVSLDYERGLYQTIKYYAVLQAMAKSGSNDIPLHIKSILVVESALPKPLRGLAARLGVVVIEKVRDRGLIAGTFSPLTLWRDGRAPR